MTKLTIRARDDWSVGTVGRLSDLLNFCKVTTLVLDVDLSSAAQIVSISELTDLLQRTANLISLSLRGLPASIESSYVIIPSHVKHLCIPVNSFEQVKMIRTRCEHLSSVVFEFSTNSSSLITDIIAWTMAENPNSTYQSNGNTLKFWLDKNIKSTAKE